MRHVAITGASSGIDAALARELRQTVDRLRLVARGRSVTPLDLPERIDLARLVREAGGA